MDLKRLSRGDVVGDEDVHVPPPERSQDRLRLERAPRDADHPLNLFQLLQRNADHFSVHLNIQLRAVDGVVTAADEPDRAVAGDLVQLVLGNVPQAEGVVDLRVRRAYAHQGDVCFPSEFERLADWAFLKDRLAKYLALRDQRRVKVVARTAEEVRQHRREQRADDGRVFGPRAADELHHLDVRPVHGADRLEHAVEGRSPRDADDVAVPQNVQEELRRDGTQSVEHLAVVFPSPDEDADVLQPEKLRKLVLKRFRSLPRIVDEDLDDPLLACLRQQPRNPRPRDAHELRDLLLRLPLVIVQMSHLGEILPSRAVLVPRAFLHALPLLGCLSVYSAALYQNRAE